MRRSATRTRARSISCRMRMRCRAAAADAPGPSAAGSMKPWKPSPAAPAPRALSKPPPALAGRWRCGAWAQGGVPGATEAGASAWLPAWRPAEAWARRMSATARSRPSRCPMGATPSSTCAPDCVWAPRGPVRTCVPCRQHVALVERLRDTVTCCSTRSIQTSVPLSARCLG